MNSQEFTCKCGKYKGWITDGRQHSNHCPHCGRMYIGRYNPKTLQIDAIEVEAAPVENDDNGAEESEVDGE